MLKFALGLRSGFLGLQRSVAERDCGADRNEDDSADAAECFLGAGSGDECAATRYEQNEDQVPGCGHSRPEKAEADGGQETADTRECRQQGDGEYAGFRVGQVGGNAGEVGGAAATARLRGRRQSGGVASFPDRRPQCSPADTGEHDATSDQDRSVDGGVGQDRRGQPGSSRDRPDDQSGGGAQDGRDGDARTLGQGLPQHERLAHTREHRKQPRGGDESNKHRALLGFHLHHDRPVIFWGVMLARVV